MRLGLLSRLPAFSQYTILRLQPSNIPFLPRLSMAAEQLAFIYAENIRSSLHFVNLQATKQARLYDLTPNFIHMSKPLKDVFDDLRSALRDPVNRDYLHKSPSIPQALLDECRLYTDRQVLIKRLSKFLKSNNGDLVIAEIGTASGAFASFLATEIKPRKIIIVDVSFTRLEKERFISPLKEMGIKVELIEKNSHDAIRDFDDSLLDLAYIDGSHTLDTVRQDLALISRKIKPGGFLVCNAYASFSLSDTCKYGVPLAFNEFVIDNGWPVVGFALESYSSHGIAAQKPL